MLYLHSHIVKLIILDSRTHWCLHCTAIMLSSGADFRTLSIEWMRGKPCVDHCRAHVSKRKGGSPTNHDSRKWTPHSRQFLHVDCEGFQSHTTFSSILWISTELKTVTPPQSPSPPRTFKSIIHFGFPCIKRIS